MYHIVCFGAMLIKIIDTHCGMGIWRKFGDDLYIRLAGYDYETFLSVQPGAPFTKLFMTELIHKTQLSTHFCPKLCSNFIKF